MSDIFTVVAQAVGAARHRDLPDIIESKVDYKELNKFSLEEQKNMRNSNSLPVCEVARRPYLSELEIFVFPQTWSSTALGYSGIGGSAMTSAYTVVVQCENTVCVYFNGDRLAYRLELNTLSSKGRENYFTDLQFHNMASVSKMFSRYE